MQVHLKNGAFKQAAFSGSATQLENEKLRKIIDPLRHQEDSLSNLLSTSKDPDVKNVIRTKIEALNRAERASYIEYVATHPHSIIAANVLKIYSSTWGKEKTQELYEKLSAEIKSSAYGRDINDYLSLAQDIRVGGRFADFEQADTEGKTIKLSAIKAKYILLEFWGSWCGPCRAENPNLVKTYQMYRHKGFEILGVAADDNKTQWLQAVKQDKLPWPNVCDLKGDQNKAVLIYGINAFPTNFLIDENGVIIAKNLRGEALQKKLAELLP
ncbi:Thiol-disulfide oxidoreductase ResA [compost metagenome]